MRLGTLPEPGRAHEGARSDGWGGAAWRPPPPARRVGGCKTDCETRSPSSKPPRCARGLARLGTSLSSLLPLLVASLGRAPRPRRAQGSCVLLPDKSGPLVSYQ